jgi:hypothetical protein
MAGSLPDQKRKEFMASDIRLKLEYLRERLAGREGLYRDGQRFSKPTLTPPRPVTPQRLRETLQYIGEFSTHHPDPEIGSVLKYRVSQVVAKMNQTSEDRNDA